MPLLNRHTDKEYEAGCDEAGRGCLAGPVFASAVILPMDFYHPDLNDSKKLDEATRYVLREFIESHAVAYAVAKLDAPDIDKYNILWASVRTMHLALDQLSSPPEHILVDGNKFIPYHDIPHDCIVKGDGKYSAIAAASILAKTYRDDYMVELHSLFPSYHWDKNKGYPTSVHREAILTHGPNEYHRKSFRLYPKTEQLKIF